MDSSLRFRVLGTLEVLDGTRPVAVPQGKVTVLLAALLLRANQVVPAAELVDRLWDADAPARPRRALHVYVARLRRALGVDVGSALIVARSGGYLIEASPDTLDLLCVRKLLDLAKRAQAVDDLAGESALLTEALSRWQRPILVDVRSDVLHRDEADRIDEDWTASVERRIDVDLILGRHGELAGELAGLVAQFPLRERFCAQLMTALYRSGRQGEALVHYDRLRRQLADDLGVDPGPDLQRLHQRVLAADPTLAPPAAARPVPVPRQLPAPPQAFTGRARDLAELDRRQDTGAVVVSSIDGMAGVGKTALAVEAAHRLADQFPDGQIFFDLRGFTQGEAPVDPADALDRMLCTLGLPCEHIPAHLDDRAALLRTTLAGRRVLIVLDNAATEAQVRPLLPGAPGCLVLITSRRRLTGLDGAHPLSLDVLPPRDAVALFARTAGEQRLMVEPPELVEEVVGLCGHLPLAIRIAAVRLRSRPAWTLADLADRLRRHPQRLAELGTGQQSVAAVLDMSYQHLTPQQQRCYRLLSLHPGVAFDTHAAAALADIAPTQAGTLLDGLLDTHLLDQRSRDSYGFHDLIRAHAIGQLRADHTDTDQTAALVRLNAYYLHTAATAMTVLYPHEAHRRPRIAAPDIETPALNTASALAWLDTQRPNLVATTTSVQLSQAGQAAGGDDSQRTHTIRLSATIARYLLAGGHHTDAITIHDQALIAARATRNRAAEAAVLHVLGITYWSLGRYDQALERLHAAETISTDIEDRSGRANALNALAVVELDLGHYDRAHDRLQQAFTIFTGTAEHTGAANTLTNLGIIHRRWGHYGQALDHVQRALTLRRQTGDRAGEAMLLDDLGAIHLLQGRDQQAYEHCQQALTLARQVGHRLVEAYALNNLGQVFDRWGRLLEAADHHQQALAILRQIGDRSLEANVLSDLGTGYRRTGRYDDAAAHHHQAMIIARAIGNRSTQARVLNRLGETNQAIGRPHTALIQHTSAHDLARALGEPYEHARAHHGIAHIHSTLDHPDQARIHWQRTLTILTSIGLTTIAETDIGEIRAHLSELDGAREAAPPETGFGSVGFRPVG